MKKKTAEKIVAALAADINNAFAPSFRARVKRIMKIREQAGRLYDRSDAILRGIVADMPLGVSVTIGTKRYTLVDQFAEKEVVFRPVGVRRFDIHTSSEKVAAAKKGKK